MKVPGQKKSACNKITCYFASCVPVEGTFLCYYIKEKN
jgi:hypothetical protein